MLVTGSSGRIGRVFGRGWPGPLTPFDRPAHDARDPGAVAAAARGHDAILALAWDPAENWEAPRPAHDGLTMALAALEAACAAGVPRVVLASSVHAEAWWPPVAGSAEPVPTGPYGATKLAIEALGRHFAAHRGLEVVAIRFGAVNEPDRPGASPMHRSVWLSYEACRTAVRAALTDPLGSTGYAVRRAVGGR